MNDMNTTNRTLIKIKNLMSERNWTLYRLSKESGIPYNTLRNLFVRNNEPSYETARRICNCFEISISDLLEKNTISVQHCDYSMEEKQLIADYRSLNRNNKKLLQTYLYGLMHILPKERKQQ